MAAAKRIEPAIGTWFIERPKGALRCAAPGAGARTGDDLRLLSAAVAAAGSGRLLPVQRLQARRAVAAQRRGALVSRARAGASLPDRADPGEHAAERLPKERDYTAFIEGWGEYASDLAGEMGMYTDPYDRAGRLSMDLFLSTRLVVDTGMNALGWSRERAMDYMRAHTLRVRDADQDRVAALLVRPAGAGARLQDGKPHDQGTAGADAGTAWRALRRASLPPSRPRPRIDAARRAGAACRARALAHHGVSGAGGSGH